MSSRIATFRSPIFRKFLLTALSLITVTLAVAGALVIRYTANRELLHAERELDGMLRVLAPQLPSLPSVALDDWARRTDQLAHARVSVIDHMGIVLADSEHDPTTMENHAHRPEVAAALAGRTGTFVRRSATLDLDFCYVAIPAELPGQARGVLRLAMPLEQVRISSAQVRALVIKSFLAAALLALLVAYLVARAFTRRIRSIEAYSTDLVAGRFSGSLAADADDELGSVARALRNMAGQFRDMLDRLARESAQRRAILASMVEGVLAVDADLRVTFCNDSLANAVRARIPVAEGMPLLQLIRDPGLLDLLARVIETGESDQRRLLLLASGGRVYDVQAAPLEHRPRPGALAILHDVTELERLERVRKDLVVNISHELRTPLAAIRGYAETLLDGALEDPSNNRKFLGIINNQVNRLADMASDLLTLAELESGRTAPASERIPLRDAAEAALSVVAPEAEAAGVILLAGNLDGFAVSAPPGRLERVLQNLLHNAVRFNHPGGEVWLEAAPAPDGRISITVEDTGIGIPHEELPRIFERFYCVDKSRSRETGGSGMGLAIVKHIVEQMSGTVTVESSLGKGSVFTLLLPAA